MQLSRSRVEIMCWAITSLEFSKDVSGLARAKRMTSIPWSFIRWRSSSASLRNVFAAMMASSLFINLILGVGKRELPITSSRSRGRRRWWVGRGPGWPSSAWEWFSSRMIARKPPSGKFLLKVPEALGRKCLAGLLVSRGLPALPMVYFPRVRGGYNMNPSTP